MARPASGDQRLGHCRGMGLMVVEASGSLRFRFGVCVAAAITRNAGAAPVRLTHCGAGGELELYRPRASQIFQGALSATGLDDNLPILRPPIG